MRTPNTFNTITAAIIVAILVTGCTDSKPSDQGLNVKAGDDKKPAPTNRIDVSPSVRKNLGITFVKTERRNIESTLRAPGQFELQPAAKRNYHTTLAGRVQLNAGQYDRVQPGDLMARIDSPRWLEFQRSLSDTVTQIRQLQVRLKALSSRHDAIAKHESRLHEEESIWLSRVSQIEKLIEAGSGAATTLAEARSALASTRTSLAKVEEEKAEFDQQRVDFESQLDGHRRSTPLLYADASGTKANATQERLDLAMGQASSMTGLPLKELLKDVDDGDAYVPQWRTLRLIDIKAKKAGVVQHIHVTNGEWIEAGGHFITTIDPKALRFRAIGLQSNLNVLADGQLVRIVPPRSSSQALTGQIEGTLLIGLNADSLQRKIDLVATPKKGELPTWARAGVAAEMEIVTSKTARPQISIPVSAVIQDGLEKVLFRRDPKDPNKVIRMEADLGQSDGRWIAVESGLTDGDEVVVSGVYELMLTGSGRAKGGHFHADGTWHADDH